MSNLSVRILARFKHHLTLRMKEYETTQNTFLDEYKNLMGFLSLIEKEETEFESGIECETERKCDSMKERQARGDIYDI